MYVYNAIELHHTKNFELMSRNIYTPWMHVVIEISS